MLCKAFIAGESDRDRSKGAGTTAPSKKKSSSAQIIPKITPFKNALFSHILSSVYPRHDESTGDDKRFQSPLLEQSDFEREVVTGISLHVRLDARHHEREHAPCQIAPSGVMRDAQDDVSYSDLVSFTGKLGGGPIVQAGMNSVDYGLNGEGFMPVGRLSDRIEL